MSEFKRFAVNVPISRVDVYHVTALQHEHAIEIALGYAKCGIEPDEQHPIPEEATPYAEVVTKGSSQ